MFYPNISEISKKYRKNIIHSYYQESYSALCPSDSLFDEDSWKREEELVASFVWVGLRSGIAITSILKMTRYVKVRSNTSSFPQKESFIMFCHMKA